VRSGMAEIDSTVACARPTHPPIDCRVVGTPLPCVFPRAILLQAATTGKTGHIRVGVDLTFAGGSGDRRITTD